MFGHCWIPQLSPQAVLERRWQWFGQVDTLVGVRTRFAAFVLAAILRSHS